MTQRRWRPDPHLVMSARAGGVRGANLPPCDRAWAVALLMEGQGLTGAEVAETLKCSLRLVRLIRAEPLYPLAVHAAALTRQLADTESAGRNEVARQCRARAEAESALCRARMQRDRLIEDLASARAQMTYYREQGTAC